MEYIEGKKLGIREGLLSGIPLVIGFIPVAMTFGILSKSVGLTIIESVLCSGLVVAGSSQFIALNLIQVGAGFTQIIITTLLVNFRHFLMSASFASKYKNNIGKSYPLVAFVMTDEVFSVSSFENGQITKEYMLSMESICYLSWVGGTFIGYLVGKVLPPMLVESMEIALYAMFIAILVPQVKKSIKILILAISSGLVNTFLSYLNILPQGWSLVISIVLVSLLGALIFRENHDDNLEGKEDKIHE